VSETSDVSHNASPDQSYTQNPQPSSEHDLLSALASSVRDAQAAVKKTAAENCIDEQIAYSDCTRNGGWYARLTMCRDENRKLNRCTEMQARFLRALGYQSLFMKVSRGEVIDFPAENEAETDKSPKGLEVEKTWDRQREAEPLERMQLHADKLYREMLERERVSKESTPDKSDSASTTTTLGSNDANVVPVMDRERTRTFWPSGHNGSLDELLETVDPKVRAHFTNRLEELGQEERALEERLIEAQLREVRDQQVQVAKAMKEEKRARLERKRRGEQTIGDRLKWLGGWSQDEDTD
jgi:hypothetical protein